MFKETTESKKPLEVAKQCIHPGASKKDINRYLHHLRNAGFLSLTYHKGTNADPRYSALPEIRQISGYHFELTWAFLIATCPSSVRSSANFSHFIFFRATMPISTKLSTMHPWVKGVQVCLNKGPHPFERGDKKTVKKYNDKILKFSSPEALGQYQPNLI